MDLATLSRQTRIQAKIAHQQHLKEVYAMKQKQDTYSRDFYPECQVAKYSAHEMKPINPKEKRLHDQIVQMRRCRSHNNKHFPSVRVLESNK